MNAPKTMTPEKEMRPPDAKASLNGGPMSGPLASPRPRQSERRQLDLAHAILRILCLLTSVIALSVMVSAKDSGSISLFGLKLPLYSKWSFSDSFRYLVGVSAAVAAHSLLQLLISTLRLLGKCPVIASRNHAWLLFAGDQAFAYAMMSAGSAASGVTNLNRTGIQHAALPNFCEPLHRFCDRVAVSIAFAFVSCFLLAASAVVDVIWLSKYSVA
ncbi:hypothetical protein NMG60_11002555 [Bertholletia excelsa]